MNEQQPYQIVEVPIKGDRSKPLRPIRAKALMNIEDVQNLEETGKKPLVLQFNQWGQVLVERDYVLTGSEIIGADRRRKKISLLKYLFGKRFCGHNPKVNFKDGNPLNFCRDNLILSPTLFSYNSSIFFCSNSCTFYFKVYLDKTGILTLEKIKNSK